MLNQNQLKTALSILEFFLGLAQPTCSVYVYHVSGFTSERLLIFQRHSQNRYSCWLGSETSYPLSPKSCWLSCHTFSFFIESLTGIYSHTKDKDGLNTKSITAMLILEQHIPEWIPMYGCKVRAYYHRMLLQCINCWELVHFSKCCKNDKKDWKGYIKALFKTGKLKKKEMFGTWLEEEEESNKTRIETRTFKPSLTRG